jgi:hypothetical protein
MIDNLGGRLGSFDRLEKELAPGRCWSAFDRAIDGSAFFAARVEANPRTMSRLSRARRRPVAAGEPAAAAADARSRLNSRK